MCVFSKPGSEGIQGNEFKIWSMKIRENQEEIGVHSAFIQKYQVFQHLRSYDFFPFSAFFLHIEHGHAHLHRVISFSVYSPLHRLPVPRLNSWQKDAASPVSLLL